MDIGSGFGGDDRQRYLRIALVAGVVLVILLLVLIVVAIVNNRRGAADATATPPARTATRPAIVASPSTSASARPTVAVSVAPSAAPSAAPSSGAPATSAAPSASTGRKFVVANTGGEGVRLRAEPTTTGQEIAVLPDGHRLTEVGPGRNSDGRDWLNVQDENGNKGWVAAEFTSPAP